MARGLLHETLSPFSCAARWYHLVWSIAGNKSPKITYFAHLFHLDINTHTLHYYNISRSNGIYFLSNHIHGLLVIWTSLFRSKERLPFSARIISWSVMGADTSLRLLWALVALRTKAMSWTQRSSFCVSFVAKEPPCFVRKGISLESKYNASGLIPKPGKRLRIVASRMWNASRILRY